MSLSSLFTLLLCRFEHEVSLMTRDLATRDQQYEQYVVALTSVIESAQVWQCWSSQPHNTHTYSLVTKLLS